MYITYLIIQKGDDRDEIEAMVRSTVEQEFVLSNEIFVSLRFLCFCFISSFVCRSLLSVFLSYETLPFVSCYVVPLCYVFRHMCLI